MSSYLGDLNRFFIDWRIWITAQQRFIRTFFWVLDFVFINDNELFFIVKKSLLLFCFYVRTWGHVCTFISQIWPIFRSDILMLSYSLFTSNVMHRRRSVLFNSTTKRTFALRYQIAVKLLIKYLCILKNWLLCLKSLLIDFLVYLKLSSKLNFFLRLVLVLEVFYKSSTLILFLRVCSVKINRW